MSKAVRYVLIGGVAFGGIFYGRLYVDVLTAESAVRSIEREVRVVETERENLQHEITSNRKALVELESKGTAKLKEQASIQHRVDEESSLLTKLKNELLQSKNDFERVQLKIKETSNKIDRLRLRDTEKGQMLEMALGRKENAKKDAAAARRAMELKNLPVMGPLLFKRDSSD